MPRLEKPQKKTFATVDPGRAWMGPKGPFAKNETSEVNF